MIRSWCTGRGWLGCFIWYSEERTGQSRSLPRPLFAVPNVTAHLSTASIPITVLLYNGPLLCDFNVPVKGLTPAGGNPDAESYPLKIWHDSCVVDYNITNESYKFLKACTMTVNQLLIILRVRCVYILSHLDGNYYNVCIFFYLIIIIVNDNNVNVN